MRDDRDHNEQLDAFSQFIKQKLEDHRMPVDMDCLKDIEAQMPAVSGKNRWWWMGASIAAAVAVLFLLILPFGDIPEESRLADLPPVQEQAVLPEKRPATLVEEVAPKETRKEVPALAVTINKEAANEKTIQADQVTESTRDEPLKQKEGETDDKPAETIKKRADSSVAPEDNRGAKRNYHYPVSDKNKQIARKDGEWLLAASFGSGGHISLRQGVYDLVMDGPSDSTDPSVPPVPPTPPPFTNNGIVPLEEYSNVDYSLPLSFGMTVRKDFNKYVALETGLVYTYLSTKFSGYGKVSHDAKLGLHYLGIPVNAVVYLWRNQKWHVYLSGGVMMEKGIRSVHTQNRHESDGIHTTIAKENIGGLQWSLNASAGVSYRLYQDWSLYFEPRLSYYFDNYQPVSIRTDKPVIVGLGAGIRYAF